MANPDHPNQADQAKHPNCTENVPLSTEKVPLSTEKVPLSTEIVPQHRGTGTGDLGWSRREAGMFSGEIWTLPDGRYLLGARAIER